MGKARNAPQATPAGNAATPALTKLAWPRLERPSRPHSVIEAAPGILLIDDLFPPRVRKAFLAFLTAPNSPIKLNPPTAPKRGEAERTNERISLTDPDLAVRLWNDTGLRDACQAIEGRHGRRAVGLNPNMRIYRYPTGSFFGRESLPPSPPPPPRPPPARIARTRLTDRLLQLTMTTTMSSKVSVRPNGRSSFTSPARRTAWSVSSHSSSPAPGTTRASGSH